MAAVVGPVIDPERLSQRLADAAVIAGRMAHDFDNILTGIIGFSDLAPADASARIAGGRTSSPRSRKVGQRGILFTQQLHQLSRSGQAQAEPRAVRLLGGREGRTAAEAGDAPEPPGREGPARWTCRRSRSRPARCRWSSATCWRTRSRRARRAASSASRPGRSN